MMSVRITANKVSKTDVQQVVAQAMRSANFVPDVAATDLIWKIRFEDASLTQLYAAALVQVLNH